MAAETKEPVVPKSDIPENVISDFRRILGLAPDAGLPANIESIYRRYAKMNDICSAGRISAKELVLLAMLAPSAPVLPAAAGGPAPGGAKPVFPPSR